MILDWYKAGTEGLRFQPITYEEQLVNPEIYKTNYLSLSGNTSIQSRGMKVVIAVRIRSDWRMYRIAEEIAVENGTIFLLSSDIEMVSSDIRNTDIDNTGKGLKVNMEKMKLLEQCPEWVEYRFHLFYYRWNMK